MKLSAELIREARELLRSSAKIVITNHVNPDGDAMGSALGLAGVLRSRGFEVSVVVPNDYPGFLKWMRGTDTVKIYERHEEEVSALFRDADLIFHLDYNSLQRSGGLRDVLALSPAKKIMIDHHQQPEDFADLRYSEAAMSSTCEMVYHFLDSLGWADDISPAEADCLYTGLITDTGNFRFSATTPTTLEVAAALLRAGVKPFEITSRIYDTNTPDRLKLLSRALERMEVLYPFHSVIMCLDKEDLKRYNYRKGDTEGFVNYGLSISGITFSAFLAEKEGKIKISFRSKGSFDVNKLAREHFGGGGHTNAAGAVSELTLEQTVQKLRNILPLYKNELA